jgi:pimeloyl-ACP methyl ester carboxylesterase
MRVTPSCQPVAGPESGPRRVPDATLHGLARRKQHPAVNAMGDYIDVEGHPTWVDTRGLPVSDSEVVLLLHGGLSNSDLLLDVVEPTLAAKYALVAFDRRGHGRTADTSALFHYEDMATETVRVLEQVVGKPVHIVGFSDGGIIAMLVAMRLPDLVRRLVLIGTNFHVDGLQPLELSDDSPVAIALAESYAERSPDGPEHFGVVAEKAQALFQSEPTMTTADTARIHTPTLVMAGDDDMVELGHTCALYESLPAGELAVIPGASHLVVLEKPGVVARFIDDFLGSTWPPATMMTFRRARQAASTEP